MSDGTSQYVDAERLLPSGDLLSEIRGTDRAVRAVYVDSLFYDRQHWWVSHDGSKFIGVKRTEGQASVVTGRFDDAISWLGFSKHDDGELVYSDTVPVEKTPIPYKKEDTLLVECPECDRFGTTHPWKADDYIPDECACGFGGEFNVA